jgi:hypothetical protein
MAIDSAPMGRNDVIALVLLVVFLVVMLGAFSRMRRRDQ